MSDNLYQFHDADRGDEIKRRAEQAKRRWNEREVERFWQSVLANPVGRAEIWRVLVEMEAFENRFRVSPAGMTDMAATWFSHGRSTYGQAFYQQLLVIDGEAVLTMQREHDPRFQKEPVEQPSEEP